ncbi:hypothetical protein PspLS_04050 [Pyricularia sp. CBS 133598]|nr:hypothetical protein PspLS_04050 [Pyricularia sp. CBS 133598]
MCDLKPMRERLTAPWGVRINKKDVEKLTAGFQSTNMDQQWNVLVENSDNSATISVHFARSWTGHDIYILHLDNPNQQDQIQPKGKQNHPGGGTKIHSITWEGNKNGVRIDAEQAQKEVVDLARSFLRCEFDELPQYDSDEIYDHPAYKLKPRGRPANQHSGMLEENLDFLFFQTENE